MRGLSHAQAKVTRYDQEEGVWTARVEAEGKGKGKKVQGKGAGEKKGKGEEGGKTKKKSGEKAAAEETERESDDVALSFDELVSARARYRNKDGSP